MELMRIDKIIDTITKQIFDPWLIVDILDNDISWKFKIFAMAISLKKKYLLWKRWSFQWLHNIEWIKKYDISWESFDPKNKKNGITAMGRFKNSEDFLEISIRSILPYIDEVIMLVDLSSTDATLDICNKLAFEFPTQCKLYEYDQAVYPWNHEKYIANRDDSVHALSYFYNYCMSKVTYKYVMKFDDDMLCVGDDFWKICEEIRKDGLDYFLDIPQINISRSDEGDLSIANKYLSSWIAGIFWDHGIFPLSNNTYFFNDIGCENLIAPYWIKYSRTIWFLHLKNLKSGWWMKNYDGYGVEYIKKLNKGTTYISLPKKYKNILTQRGIE